MRRQRNIFDTFSESVDLNQGPSFNGFDMGEADECNNNRLSPTERRLFNNNDLSGDNHNKSPSFSSWDVGESSSRSNIQDHQVANNNNNINWSPSFGNNNHDSRYKDRTFELSVGPIQNSGSNNNHTHMDVDLNVEYGVNNNNSSNDGSGSVDMEIPNERGTHGSLFSYEVQSSPMMVNREPINLESSQRYFEQRSTNSSSQRSNIQPPLMHVPGMSRNLLPFPWSGNINSRNGSSSSSGFSRSNRNSVQDPTNWSLSTGRPSINGANGANVASSSSRNDAFRIPNLNATAHDQPRLNDIPPWTLFPSSEPEIVGHRGHFRPFPPSPFSEENIQPSASNSHSHSHGRHHHHQPVLRSLEVPDDEWRVFAGEGRDILVSEMRQILNALRRNENLRAEDYMLFDPFINGVADLHDRHRDMRLDVENWSYEELLALEERMGDVKTGLSEEVIVKSMKQRKHMFFMAISTQSLEPCCICREEYQNGDDIGTLDCGHDFHTCCIKQWLTQKNLCPICKKTALST